MSARGSTLPPFMRLVVARCSVDYSGRLRTHLGEAVRLLMFKADGTFMVWSDHGGSSVKPLNWMTPPTVIEEEPGKIDRPQASRHHRGPRRDLDKRGPVGRHARDVRSRGGPGPRQGRGRGAPAGAAGRAAGLVRRRVPAGAARVADRHRAGGPDVPRRRRRSGWRSRSSAWRGSRRSSSSRATWTGSGSDPGVCLLPRRPRRADDQAPGACAGAARGASSASRSTSTCCEASASRT